jgi:hypothetical protein
LTAQLNKSVNDASAVLEDKIALLRREARERDDAAQTRHAQFHSETLALLRKEAENRAETAKIRDVQQTFEMETLRSNIAALNELLASRMAQLCDDFKVRDEQRASEIVQLRTDTQEFQNQQAASMVQLGTNAQEFQKQQASEMVQIRTDAENRLAILRDSRSSQMTWVYRFSLQFHS